MKKVGLFGGTFDPIHNGHLNIAYEALYNLLLDEVIFIPAGNPPHKMSSEITDGFLRYELVVEATKNQKKFLVCDYEIKKQSRSYTYDTIKYIKSIHEGYDMYLMVGSDCFLDLEKWKSIQGILDNTTLVVFGRNESNLDILNSHKVYMEEKFKAKIIILKTPILEISSTIIRNKIKKGQNISYLVPFEVNELITSKKLYP